MEDGNNMFPPVEMIEKKDRRDPSMVIIGILSVLVVGILVFLTYFILKDRGIDVLDWFKKEEVTSQESETKKEDSKNQDTEFTEDQGSDEQNEIVNGTTVNVIYMGSADEISSDYSDYIYFKSSDLDTSSNVYLIKKSALTLDFVNIGREFSLKYEDLMDTNIVDGISYSKVNGRFSYELASNVKDVSQFNESVVVSYRGDASEISSEYADFVYFGVSDLDTSSTKIYFVPKEYVTLDSSKVGNSYKLLFNKVTDLGNASGASYMMIEGNFTYIQQ